MSEKTVDFLFTIAVVVLLGSMLLYTVGTLERCRDVLETCEVECP